MKASWIPLLFLSALLVRAQPAETSPAEAAASPIEARVAPTAAAATLSEAGLADPNLRFSFSAEGVPIKQALALFARANGLNIVPDLDVDGEVTVDFRDLPLDLAMSALLEANGYYFTREGRLLRVRNRETRLFHVDYIQGTRSGQGSSAVQISSGGSSSGGGGGGSSSGGSGGSSGGSEGSVMTVTNSATINFWSELGDQLKTMISPKGSYTINSLAGTVMVTDSHQTVQTVAHYLASVTENVVRQVDLEVEIYEIALNKSTQLGVNWQVLAEHIDTNFNTIPGQIGLTSAGGLIVQNPVYGPAVPPTGIQATFSRGGITAIVDALKQQGDLKIVSKPRLRTLNNQPSVVRVGQDIPVFLRQVTQSPGSPPTTTTSETIQTITVGTVLSITPQVSEGGLITLDISPAVSRLVRIDTSASGDTKAPVIDIRQASSIVRIRDGATVVMGGLVQDSATTTHRKIPLLGDIPILGKAFSGSYETSERTELIFFITPRVIGDLAAEKAIKTAAK
jgi:MSHA biogenesis protein MshL